MNLSGWAPIPGNLNATDNLIALDAEAMLTSNGGRIFAHELGHYFGLLHTQHFNPHVVTTPYLAPWGGCFVCDLDETIPSGWNCATIDISGDGICDTPADPGPMTCGYGCNPPLPCNDEEDPNDELYMPDRNNIMSYYFGYVPEYFTVGQLDRVWEVLNNHPNRTFLLNANASCTDAGKVNKVGFDDNSTLQFEPIQGVDVEIDFGNSMSVTEVTDALGEYDITMNGVLDGLDELATVETLEVTGDMGAGNYGVTTYDMFFIKLHILGLSVLPKPEYWIAADANYDGSISTLDLVEIQKIILQIETDFQRGNWAFVPEYYLTEQFDFRADYEDNPFTAIFEDGSSPGRPYLYSNPGVEDKTYFNEFDMNLLNPEIWEASTWNFRAIKIGDVNGSVLDEGGIIDGDPIVVNIIQNVIGDKITFDFEVSDFEDIVAYQMAISYDVTQLSYLGSEGKDLSGVEEYFFSESSSEQLIRTLWYDEINANAQTLLDGQSIFSLNFQGNNPNAVLDVVESLGYNARLSSNDGNELVSFAVDGEGKYHPIINLEDSALQLVNAFPNPFESSLTIKIISPTKKHVLCQVFDLLGREVFVSTEYLAFGLNAVQIPNLEDMPGGCYFVKITDGHHSTSVKVVKE